MPNTGLYSLTSTPNYKTVGDLLSDTKSICNIYRDTPDYFLNIVGADGVSNRIRIYSSFPFYQQLQLSQYDALALPLPAGTLLYLEQIRVDNNVLTAGIEIASNDTLAFKSSQLALLEADSGYQKIDKPNVGFIQNGTLKTQYPSCMIWLWCKSLTPGLSDDELEGQFFDLTPFIENLSTNVSRNGGLFEITLPPLVAELDQQNRWVIKRSALTQYQGGYVAQGSLYDVQPDEAGQPQLRRNELLFKNLVTANDLVFIRFESLKMEQEQRSLEQRDYNIDRRSLPGKIFDMIGLVDQISTTVNAQNNDVTIRIQGRDLNKLFLDDGSYFFALENTQGMIKIAGETRLKNSLIARCYDGSLSFLNLYQGNTIETIVKFIIQQLSNIKIVPDDLFLYYGNRRNMRYDVVNDKQLSGITSSKQSAPFNYNYKAPLKEELAPGIWQIVSLVMDDEIKKRRVFDTSFSTAAGCLVNYIRGIAQSPLVEYYADTYGDKFYLTFRKLPYDQKSIISQLEGRQNTENSSQNVTPIIVDIEPEDVIQENLYMNDSECYSWYHFYPQAAVTGSSSDYSMSYLPAVFFQEFADVFGSRPFQQSHCYVPFDKNANLADMEAQATEDLKYVIESSQYLPFSRKGTITLNGDRRIKIGNMIRYKATGEVYYVEHVIQNYAISMDSVERTTTIHVARGLVESLIYGTFFRNSNGETRYISYFNIIDTRLNPLYKQVPKTQVRRKRVGTKEVQVADISLEGAINTVSNGIDKVESFFGINGLDGKILKPEMNSCLDLLNQYTNTTSRNIFIRFINRINEMGYKTYLTETIRPFDEQVREKRLNKYNAVPGNSRHDIKYQTAIDLNIISKDGKWYQKHTPTEQWLSTGVPQLAKSMGLRWGGDSFGNYKDRVHFEIPAGTKAVMQDVYEDVTETKMVQAYNFDQTFANFKVNKFSLNFFLKNMQFDPQYRIVKNRQVYNPDGSLPEVIITNKK